MIRISLPDKRISAGDHPGLNLMNGSVLIWRQIKTPDFFPVLQPCQVSTKLDLETMSELGCPNYVMNISPQCKYVAIVASAHLSRADAFCYDARVWITVSDPSHKFDFSQPRKEFA